MGIAAATSDSEKDIAAKTAASICRNTPSEFEVTEKGANVTGLNLFFAVPAINADLTSVLNRRELRLGLSP